MIETPSTERTPTPAEVARRCFETGTALLDRQDWAQAAHEFERGLQALPGRPSLLANLALACWQLGERPAARRHAEDALAGAPDMLSAAMTLALCQQAAGEYRAALASCDRALAAHPDAAAAWANRALALQALDQLREAHSAFARALDLDPLQAGVWSDLALLLLERGEHEEALEAVERAIRQDPGLVAGWVNRGRILDALARPEDALASIDQALALAPRHPAALLNRGTLCDDLGLHEAALAAFAAVPAGSPEAAEAGWNRAHALLAMGDYPAGWRDYEARWALPGFGPRRDRGLPRLRDLASAAGARVLVWCEQGLGDTLQFCRFLAPLAALGAELVFVVPATLFPVLSGLSRERLQVRADDDADARHGCDWQIPLMSLPGLLGCDLFNVPDTLPYLQAPRERLATWRLRLGVRGRAKTLAGSATAATTATFGAASALSRPRVAIACSGNPRHPDDAFRTLPLAQLLPLQEHAELVLVQQDLRCGDQAIVQSGRLRWIGGSLGDFGDTAAALANCDLLISVDTSVAHLNAAMGRLTWLLLPAHSDWRWLRGRTDSPWYPGNVRLFRQSRQGDWTPALAQLHEALADFALAGAHT